MFEISRGQVLVYAAIAAVLVVVGISSLRGGEDAQPDLTGTAPAAAPGPRSGASSRNGDGGGLAITGGDRKVVVDVSGAVARPGVYRLAGGSRVIDAIRRAGGPARGAMVGAINRAAVLADGQQVVLPKRAAGSGAGGGGSVPGPAGPVGSGGSGTGGSGPVSLGTATSDQLQQIDGIGPVTAEKIIEFRDSQGGLGSVEELDQVSGIGPVTMESLRSALQP